MNNIITFGGVSSADYGIFAPGLLAYDMPRRRMQSKEIPGRTGNLVIDKDTYENVNVTASMIIPADYLENYFDYIAAINSIGGYQILEESARGDGFWYGCLHTTISPVATTEYNAGKYQVVWDCKPQRWLRSGLTLQTFSSDGSITNPTLFVAKPNIRVYGYGTVTVGNITVTISQHEFDYIDIDCEAMAAFNGAVNANSLVSMSSDSFPTLDPGATGIRMTGNVTSVEIQPRWWSL